MARWFRLFEKKRGNRRTGSDRIAGLWELAFFVGLFLLGCLGFWLILRSFLMPELRAGREFLPTSARVLEVRLGTAVREGQTLYRPEICVEYRVAGRIHRVWTYDIHTAQGNGYSVDREHAERSLRSFRAGQSITAWYDPTRPEVAVVERGIRWWTWLFLLIPFSFVVLGAGGISYHVWRWGKSVERLAVQGKPLALSLSAHPDAALFPFVPEIPSGIEQPGEHLPYRLPVLGLPSRALMAWLAAAVFWNGSVLGLSVGTYHAGKFDWSFTLFLIPCLMIGLTLVAAFFRQWMVTTAIGQTVVEISDFPLLCGQRYRVYLRQTGWLKMNYLEMLLVCEEEATFQHGTNTRREARRVWQKTLVRHEKFEILRSVPFEVETDVDIPGGMMHSFRSPHNEVRWRLHVRGNAQDWPIFERIFPLVVLPGPARKAEGTGWERRTTESVPSIAASPERAERSEASAGD